MGFSYLTRTLRLITLTALLFPFLTTLALAQISYIIVHAHNPEGLEIASIQGVSQNSVGIYDGGTLIGYGAHDVVSHNQPITISSGSHTIKVKFNGITLEQNIVLNSGETKVLTFIFERTELDLAPIIGEKSSTFYGTTHFHSGGPMGGIDEWEGVPDWVSVWGINGPYTAETKIKINMNLTPSSFIANSEFIELGFVGHYAWISYGFIDFGISHNIDVQSFDKWFIQGYVEENDPTKLGRIMFKTLTTTYDVSFEPGVHQYRIKNLSAKLAYNWFGSKPYTWEHMWWSACELAVDSCYWESIPNVYYIHNVYYFNMNLWLAFGNLKFSSIPYDLLGTGIGGGMSQPPVASFICSPEEPSASEKITLDASSSNDPDGTIVKYEWDFGDGYTADGVQVIHAYAEAGEHTVTLTVTDNDGLTGSTKLSFIVKAEIVMTFDDGPVGDIKIESGDNSTARVLLYLRGNDIQRDIKATFFIQTHASYAGGGDIGEELIRQENLNGHIVAIHTGGKGLHWDPKHYREPFPGIWDKHWFRAKADRPEDLYDADEDGVINEQDGKNALECDLVAAKKRIYNFTGTTPEFVRPPYYDYGRTLEDKQRVLDTYTRQNLKMILTDAKGEEGGFTWPGAGIRAAIFLKKTIKDAISNYGMNQIVVTLHDTNNEVANFLIDPGLFSGSLLNAIIEGVKEGLELNSKEEAMEYIEFINSREEMYQILKAKDRWVFN